MDVLSKDWPDSLPKWAIICTRCKLEVWVVIVRVVFGLGKKI